MATEWCGKRRRVAEGVVWNAVPHGLRFRDTSAVIKSTVKQNPQRGKTMVLALGWSRRTGAQVPQPSTLHWFSSTGPRERFSLRGGVAISSFIVGSIKQTKHAVGMQQGGARSRTQCPGGDGDGRRAAACARHVRMSPKVVLDRPKCGCWMLAIYRLNVVHMLTC